MSTRANIILYESFTYKSRNGRTVNKTNKLYFYRHSDGYPEGSLPLLKVFMNWLTTGKIRNTLGQSAGWLVILGAIEYNSTPEYLAFTGSENYGDLDTVSPPKDWKCGSIEPTIEIHGDSEFLYEINLNERTLIVKQRTDNWDKLEFTEIKV